MEQQRELPEVENFLEQLKIKTRFMGFDKEDTLLKIQQLNTLYLRSFSEKKAEMEQYIERLKEQAKLEVEKLQGQVQEEKQRLQAQMEAEVELAKRLAKEQVDAAKAQETVVRQQAESEIASVKSQTRQQIAHLEEQHRSEKEKIRKAEFARAYEEVRQEMLETLRNAKEMQEQMDGLQMKLTQMKTKLEELTEATEGGEK